MLYKVTPMMPSADDARKAARKAREPGQPRKKRKTAIYDAEGHEVLITLMCLKCKSMKPLAQFGLRKMADGAIRNQPWCRTCRGSAGQKKKEEVTAEVEAAEVETTPTTPAALHADAPVEAAQSPEASAPEASEPAPHSEASEHSESSEPSAFADEVTASAAEPAPEPSFEQHAQAADPA